MDFYDVIKTRRSVRAYRPDPVPENVLKRVMNAARIAPSGGNRQPSRYIVVKDEMKKQALVPLCNGQRFIAQAPVIIVACGKEIQTNRGGYMGELSVILDVGIAVDHLTLAARAEGLGTCWIGSFKNNEIKSYLDIPSPFQVVALTPLGYPDGDHFVEITDRKKLDDIMCVDKWRF